MQLCGLIRFDLRILRTYAGAAKRGGSFSVGERSFEARIGANFCRRRLRAYALTGTGEASSARFGGATPCRPEVAATVVDRYRAGVHAAQRREVTIMGSLAQIVLMVPGVDEQTRSHARALIAEDSGSEGDGSDSEA
mgnify:CR=1 FL=1